MPPVILAAAATFGTQVVLGATITAAVKYAVVAAVVSYASQALAPKPKGAEAPVQQLTDRTVMVREPITSGKLHLGRLKYSGKQSFAQNSGAGNSKFHLLLSLCANRLQAFDELWLNDELVPLDNEGRAIGKWAGLVRCWFGDGTEAGDAALHAALQAAVGEEVWTDSHQQRGWSKLYIEFTYRADLLGSGLPNVALVGNTCPDIYDPRSETTGYTDNAALTIAWYLTQPKDWGGYGLAWEDIDEAELIAAANICDEIAARKAVSVAFTAGSSDLITVADQTAHLRTGTRVTVSSSGSLPGGLAPATHYFWIALGDRTGKLATSLVNARARMAVDITSSGSGTHQLHVNGEPRYTLNGTIDTAIPPAQLLPRLLTAMAGQVIPNGGKWKLRAGAWRGAVTPGFTQDMLIDGFTTNWFRSPEEVANGVKGTFLDPDASWKPTDFPSISVPAYLDADQGYRTWRDVDLPYTDSPSMAQRIARIDLERSRRQITLPEVTTKLAMLGIMAGDTVTFDWPRHGWSGKTFEVQTSMPSIDTRDNVPALTTRFSLAEIDANVFAWNPADEIDLPLAPRTSLHSPSQVAAPTDLALQSGDAANYLRQDGTVMTRIRVIWERPDDIYVVSGGQIELQFKPSGESVWIPGGIVDGDVTEAYISDANDGEFYDVRLRAWNGHHDACSDWVAVSEYLVEGKGGNPSDVTGLTVQQNGDVTTQRWNQAPDADLAGYELRYMAAPFVWENAIRITSVTRGTLVTNTGLPPGEWVVGIKAFDTSGNASLNACTYPVTIVNTYSIVAGGEEAPRWPGVITDGLRHDVSGCILPDSTMLAAAMSDEELWDQFNAYPVAEFRYQSPEIDLGFDAQLRAYATLQAALAPGISAGAADPVLEIDWRQVAGSYDGFEPWNAGTIAARYIKMRARIVIADGLALLSGFRPVADVKLRDEGDREIQVPPGGATIVFANRFHQPPNVQVSAKDAGGLARYATYNDVTVSGFFSRVYDAGGLDTGGTINYKASGP